MELLRIKGAHIETDSVDRTPLQVAASRGNVEAVKSLLSHGANVGKQNFRLHFLLIIILFKSLFVLFLVLTLTGSTWGLRNIDKGLIYLAKHTDMIF